MWSFIENLPEGRCLSNLGKNHLSHTWYPTGLTLIHSEQDNMYWTCLQFCIVPESFALPSSCQTCKWVNFSFHQNTGVRTWESKSPFGIRNCWLPSPCVLMLAGFLLGMQPCRGNFSSESFRLITPVCWGSRTPLVVSMWTLIIPWSDGM